MTPYELFYNSFIKNHVFYTIQLLNTIWLFIELALCIYKGFAAVYFVRAFCGGKNNGKLMKPRNILFSLLYSLILLIEYFFCGMFENVGLLISALPLLSVLMIYAFLFCGRKRSEKIIAPLTANGIILVVTTLCNQMTVEQLGKMLEKWVIFSEVEELWSVLFISPVLIYFVMYVLLMLFHKTDITGRKSIVQWAIVSGALTVSVFSALLLFKKYADHGNYIKLSLFTGITIASFVMSDVFVFLLLTDTVKKNKAVNELNLLRQTEEYNRQYITHLQSEYETVSKLRHDCKNSLLMLSALLENGEADKARKQISDSLGAMTRTEIFINTDNPVVNAVANAKLSAAKSLGIECGCFVIRDISGINDYDLCRLLSNMLDNAITACKSCSGQRRLSLAIRGDENCYYFTVKNSISKSVLESNPELKSTKEDVGHGYGVGIIREIAEKYGGRRDFYEEDGMFCCSARLCKTDK